MQEALLQAALLLPTKILSMGKWLQWNGTTKNDWFFMLWWALVALWTLVNAYRVIKAFRAG